MLSIGEFSKVTQLSVKTLRLYDEKGLLPPAHVSEETGYRYYDARSVERARVIHALRDLDFSLADIGQFLASSEDSDIVSMLEKQRDAVAQKLARYDEIQRALDALIQQQKETAMVSQTGAQEVELKQLGELLIAGIRGKGKYDDSKPRFAKLGRAAGRHIAGSPLGLYFDTEYKETDADFESCFPLKRAIEADGVSVRTLPGGRFVTLRHVGPYDTLGASYQRVFEYLRAQGLTPTTPSREVYLKGPGMIFKGNPKKYVTEIQIPVEG